jgi:putative endonuclease
MTNPRQKLGDFGEDAAAAHLATLGYQRIARKWRCQHGEIDLIMRDGQEFVFVEVRTRRGASSPSESVGPAKQRRLAALAYTFLRETQAPEEQPWRIDVVAINIGRDGRIAKLEHIRYAVEG